MNQGKKIDERMTAAIAALRDAYTVMILYPGLAELAHEVSLAQQRLMSIRHAMREKTGYEPR